MYENFVTAMAGTFWNEQGCMTLRVVDQFGEIGKETQSGNDK